MATDNILKLLLDTPTPYLTSSYLIDLFKEYKSPQHKIKLLLANADLIHIKQGLYILGEKYNKKYSKTVISGMIFGPSAISFEYALYEHGLIPERAETVTCLCFKRNKAFKTPIGLFTYKYIRKDLYPIGISYKETELGNYFLATPEKALCDLAYHQNLKTTDEAFEYINTDLRIDADSINKFDLSLLMKISKIYNNKSVHNLVGGINESRY